MERVINTQKKIEGMSVTDARRRLTGLHTELSGSPGYIPLTRYGSPVMALMSWELFESLQETMEIMGDPELMSQLRESIKDVEEENTISLDELKAELDL